MWRRSDIVDWLWVKLTSANMPRNEPNLAVQLLRATQSLTGVPKRECDTVGAPWRRRRAWKIEAGDKSRQLSTGNGKTKHRRAEQGGRTQARWNKLAVIAADRHERARQAGGALIYQAPT